jgi:pimeloyl-ACP methyl ester carboxylesterase
VDPDPGDARVLLVPGGGSSVHGTFPGLADALGPRARLIAVDPPGLDVGQGLRWLRLGDHARWLTRAVRRDGGGPVVVVGHSLGGLVALRLALDAPDVVAGLLLLDPSPLLPAALLPGGALRPVGAVRKLAARPARHRRDALPEGFDPPSPRALPTVGRLVRYLVRDGVPLAADLAAARLVPVPTTVVSAGAHAPASVARRTHERLIAWIPGARLEVWDGTTHPLLGEEQRIADAAIELLRDARPVRGAHPT